MYFIHLIKVYYKIIHSWYDFRFEHLPQFPEPQPTTTLISGPNSLLLLPQHVIKALQPINLLLIVHFLGWYSNFEIGYLTKVSWNYFTYNTVWSIIEYYTLNDQLEWSCFVLHHVKMYSIKSVENKSYWNKVLRILLYWNIVNLYYYNDKI